MRKLALIAALCLPLTAQAQDLDRAIEDFNEERFEEAIAGFYEVLKYGDARGDRKDARYYMAVALLKKGLDFSSLIFFREIIMDGPSDRHYVSAVQYILEASENLQDDYVVPGLINREYGESFLDLRDVVLNRVNLLIGQVLYRQGKYDDALAFLDPERGVPDDSIHAPASRYIVGLVNTRRGDLQGALQSFQSALELAASIPADQRSSDLERIRRQAILGLARTWYEVGSSKDEEDPERLASLQKATEFYRMIPRFTDDWGDSIFERGWAHFQLNEYGKSLGQVHSLHAPFFASSRQYAEGYILKMTNYFYNCQFDRVRRSLSQFKDFYGPIEKDLAEALTSRPADVGDEWFYEELLAAAAGTPRDSRLPANIARTVAANNRYRRLHNFLNRIAAEAEAIKAVDLFKGELSGELLTEIEAAKDQFRPFLGKLVKQKLDRQLRIVRGMMGQADIIDIQTGLAEAEWLEAQREIEFKVRKRLPRPFIPSDKFQYWPFHGEYWIDELGFYEYAIKSECVE
ncbi:MAG: hypothetical protein CMH58_06615 [Myxococcales bacterium]|nr:hypothetical protein [Myxococcales bacterium]